MSYEPQDFVAHGAYVVVPIKQGGRGKCVELRNYSTIGEALEAVGAGRRG